MRRVLMSIAALCATLAPSVRHDAAYSDLDNSVYRIMNLQERKLGIKHIGEPHKTGISVLQMAEMGHIEADPTYSPETDTINFFIMTDGGMSHELGHFYMDKLSESIGLGNWPDYSELGTDKYIMKRMMGEGVAMHFERGTFDIDACNPEFPYPPSLASLYNLEYLYEFGYNFVCPMLQIDVRRAVEYMLRNPLKPEDIGRLREYQQEAIASL